jgi:hypothetical protein
MSADRKEIMQVNLHAQVLKLRHDGYTVQEVAARVGISPIRAHVVIDDAIKELQDDTTKHAAAIREIELLRLETATKAVMPNVEEGNLGAINTLIKIQDRRAKYIGIDSPSKTNIAMVIDVPWISSDRLAYKQGIIEQSPVTDIEVITPSAKSMQPKTSLESWKDTPSEQGLAAILRNPEKP